MALVAGRCCAAELIFAEVPANSVLADAGIAAADHVRGYVPADDPHEQIATLSGPIAFDLLQYEALQRGPIVLVGSRNGTPKRWKVAPTQALWKYRLRLPVPMLDRALQALAHDSTVAPAQLAPRYGSLVDRLAKQSEWAAWLSDHAAEHVEAAKQIAAADALRERGIAMLAAPAAVDQRALLRLHCVNIFGRRADFAHSQSMSETALRELEAAGRKKTLLAAELESTRGVGLARQGRTDAALASYAAAEQLFAALAPDGLLRAWNWEHEGELQNEVGRADEAADLYRRELELRARAAPGDLAPLMSGYSVLANIQDDRGYLGDAHVWVRRAEALLAHVPDGPPKAVTLNNLAFVEMDRADFDSAERHSRDALALYRRFPRADGKPPTALCNLASILKQRGDLDGALGFARQCLQEFSAYSPHTPIVASALSTLSGVEFARGDIDAATEHARAAVALQRELTGKKPYSARPLIRLAQAQADRGRLDQASALAAEAEAVVADTGMRGSLDDSSLLEVDGSIDLKRRRFADAEVAYRRVLAIAKVRSPDSYHEANAHYELGTALRASGKTAEARGEFCAAAAAIDKQVPRLGGDSDDRARFIALNQDIVHACIEAELHDGAPDAAFATAERGRARGLLRLLAERDLQFADAAAPVLERRRAVDHRYDRLSLDLTRSAEDATEKRAQLTIQLEQLRSERAELTRQLRATSPQLANLVDPQPLNASALAAALDPGTLLLSFAVSDSGTWLFAVPAGRPQDMHVYAIALGESALRERVRDWRAMIERHDPAEVDALHAAAQALYRALLQPAEAQIAAAERLLIAADGPLNLLPFAALQRAGKPGAQYLIAWKPLAIVASGSVFAQMKSMRATRLAQRASLAAFGDPAYPAGDTSPVTERSANLRHVKPLPATRREVETLAGLYAGRAQVFLGEAATETALKRVAPGVDLVHIAAHGYFDEDHPLDSGLVLSMPVQAATGEDNGILQAWEILENVRLNADLVVLSACGTALGKEARGEGLIGLTRAFEFAGARSVVASLWNVSDASTATLMQNFYAELATGRDKDDALRAAQQAMAGVAARTSSGAQRGINLVDLDSTPALQSHPYYWAGFQLYGDWR